LVCHHSSKGSQGPQVAWPLRWLLTLLRVIQAIFCPYDPLRFRYSLRTLLAATGLVAVIAHWLTLPTTAAYRLERAIKSRGAASILLFRNSERTLLGDWATDNQIRRATVQVQPMTWQQCLRAERHVYLHLPHGESMGDMDWDIIIRVTPRRLEIVFAWS
jgi:hypothetical protein